MKIYNGIKVKAPALITNIGCGYNMMAVALENMADEIIVRKSNQSGIQITQITGDNNKLSTQLQKNAAGLAAEKLFQYLKANHPLDANLGIELEIRKKIPINCGLNSSSASAVAGAMAVNEFFGGPLSKRELLPFALTGSAASTRPLCTAAVISALLGGWFFIQDEAKPEYRRLPVPRGLQWTIIYPRSIFDTAIDLPTILPIEASLQDQRNMAGLIWGLYNTDFNLIYHSLQHSVLDPIFNQTFPSYTQLKNICYSFEALSAGFTGLGPAFYFLHSNSLKAEKCLAKLLEVYKEAKIRVNTLTSSTNLEGAIKL